MAGGAAKADSRQFPWLKHVKVTKVPPEIAVWNLGAGESEVLALTQRRLRHRALLDDAAGRACARTLGIRILGTGGLLILARRRGLIRSVSVALRSLRDAGLWLSPDIEHMLIQQAGE